MNRTQHRIVGLLALTAAIAGSAELSLETSTASAVIGGTFTVTARVAGAAPFADWQLDLVFDPGKVRLDSQAPGSFTSHAGDSRGASTINAFGELRSGGYGAADNAGGDGVLGTYTFTVLAAGDIAILAPLKSSINPFGCVMKAGGGAETLPAHGAAVALTGVDPAELANLPPVVAIPIPDQVGTVASPFTCTIPVGTFTDPDGDALTWSVSGLPAGMALDPGTHVLSGTPTGSGASTITVTATDGGGLSVDCAFVFTADAAAGTGGGGGTEGADSPAAAGSAGGCGAGGSLAGLTLLAFAGLLGRRRNRS